MKSSPFPWWLIRPIISRQIRHQPYLSPGFSPCGPFPSPVQYHHQVTWSITNWVPVTVYEENLQSESIQVNHQLKSTGIQCPFYSTTTTLPSSIVRTLVDRHFRTPQLTATISRNFRKCCLERQNVIIQNPSFPSRLVVANWRSPRRIKQ